MTRLFVQCPSICILRSLPSEPTGRRLDELLLRRLHVSPSHPANDHNPAEHSLLRSKIWAQIYHALTCASTTLLVNLTTMSPETRKCRPSVDTSWLWAYHDICESTRNIRNQSPEKKAAIQVRTCHQDVGNQFPQAGAAHLLCVQAYSISMSPRYVLLCTPHSAFTKSSQWYLINHVQYTFLRNCTSPGLYPSRISFRAKIC